MSDWVPKNKEQAEGFELGKAFIQGFSDQLKAKDVEIERLREIISEYQGMDPVWAKTLDDLTDAKAEIERLRELILPKIAEAGQWQEKYEEITRLKEENAHLAWRDADKNKLITELALGIDAVQLDTCTQEDWDALNKCANKALEATKYE